ncbi:MAG: T9SS type A sorting domain-containing protein, partial [Saprospiraceae bacterium]
GHPDYQDLDSDNDGINDIVESGNGAADTNNDGIADNPSTDTDGDGIQDSVDQTPNSFGDGDATTPNTAPADTDSDGVPDYQDLDADNDGVMDITESGNTDVDGDGIADNPTIDTDGDGIPDSIDDNDAVFGDAGDAGTSDDASDPLDANDGGTGVLPGPDTDGDGIVDSEDTLVGFGLAHDTCGSGTIEYAMTDGTQNTTGFQWNDAAVPAGDVPSSQMYGLHRSTEYCESGGWRHYYNSNETDKFLFSVEMGSNTTEIEYIEIRVAESPESRYDTTDTNAFFGMSRDWHVKTVGDAALTAPVNIRFYYVPTEVKAMLDGAIALSNSDAQSTAPTAADIVWFKKDTYDPSNDILPDGTSLTGGAGYTVLTPKVMPNANGESEVDNSALGNGVNFIQFDGITGFSGGSAFVTITGITLPVELTRFVATPEGCNVNLEWTSTSEDNFSHYELQRGENGLNFETFETIEGRGGIIEKNYHFYDESALPKGYYRLKMVDLDGRFKYSRILQVTTDCSKATDMILYPNPAAKRSTLGVKFYAKSAKANLTLLDMFGRVLKVIPFDNLDREWNTILLSLEDYPAGNYYLHIDAGDDRVSKGFVIQE